MKYQEELDRQKEELKNAKHRIEAALLLAEYWREQHDLEAQANYKLRNIAKDYGDLLRLERGETK